MNKHTFKKLGLALVLSAFVGLAQAGDEFKATGTVTHFHGDEELVVTVLEMEKPKDTFLIHVENSDSAAEGLVLAHKRVEHDGGRRISFDTTYNGEGFSTLYSEGGGWYGEQWFFQSTKYAQKKPSLYKEVINDADPAEIKVILDLRELQMKKGQLKKFAQGK